MLKTEAEELLERDDQEVPEEEQLHAEEEDLQPQKVLSTPCMPSAEEVELHRTLGHIQYRPWCDECVEGRGREMGHAAGRRSDRTVPIISFDYLFISKSGVFARSEWAMQGEQEGQKILLVRETPAGVGRHSVFAHCVPQKGSDEAGFAVDCITRDIEWIGATRVILKSDQERAIVGLLKNALKALRIEGLDQAAEEHPPAYDPQANGAVEGAVGDVKGRIRTCVLGLEARIRHRIPPDHPILTWLVQHVTFLMNVQIRGPNGDTSYQRVRGRPYRTKILEIGETCRYKLRKRDVIEGGALAARWSRGVFLGMDPKDNTYILFDNGRVETARTVARLPDARKWNMDKVAAVNTVPFNMFKPKDQTVQFREQIEGEQAKGEQKQAIARQVYMKRADFEAYGQTEGCPRCEMDMRYGYGRSTKLHSHACRTRMMGCLAQTEAGRQRLAAADERAQQYLSDHVEREATKDPHPQGEMDGNGNGGLRRIEAPPAFQPFPTPAVAEETADNVPHHAEAPVDAPVEAPPVDKRKVLETRRMTVRWSATATRPRTT